MCRGANHALANEGFQHLQHRRKSMRRVYDDAYWIFLLEMFHSSMILQMDVWASADDQISS